jgi:hypothetical protein
MAFELLYVILDIPLLVIISIFLSLYDYTHLWAVYLIKGALSIGSLPISPYYRYFFL